MCWSLNANWDLNNWIAKYISVFIDWDLNLKVGYAAFFLKWLAECRICNNETNLQVTSYTNIFKFTMIKWVLNNLKYFPVVIVLLITSFWQTSEFYTQEQRRVKKNLSNYKCPQPDILQNLLHKNGVASKTKKLIFLLILSKNTLTGKFMVTQLQWNLISKRLKI